MADSVSSYHGTPSTRISGFEYPLEEDVNGNLKSTLATLIAGEDLTNNVLKVEERFSYSYNNANGLGTVKSGAGFLHSITVGSTSAGAITVYDSIGTSSTVIATLKPSIVEATYELDVSFATGLTINQAGTSLITISYR